MINRTPMLGDWSDGLDAGFDFPEQPEMQVFDRPAERVSALLGPDGEPLMVAYPRRAIGFDLRRRE